MGLRRYFYDYDWSIGYRRISSGKELSILKIPNKHWAADPFLFERNGEVYVFYEYTDVKRYKSVLATTKIAPVCDNNVSIIYEFKGHTSYPCIFQWKDGIYIIPETIYSDSIVLLECIEWPNKWEEKAILYSGIKAADTTVFEKNGELYAFIYEITDENSCDRQLYIARVDIEKCCLHDLKLVKEYHEKTGRPGGNVIRDGNQYIRVVQSGQNFYGEKLEFYSFEYENGKYSEKKLKELLPFNLKICCKKRIVGVHTYNRCGDYEVFDLRNDYKFDLFRTIKRVFQILNIFGYGLCDQRKQYIDGKNPAHRSEK